MNWEARFWIIVLGVVIVGCVVVWISVVDDISGTCVRACEGINKYGWSYEESKELCEMNENQYKCCTTRPTWSKALMGCSYMDSPEQQYAEEIAECESLHALIGKDVDCEELIK